MAMALRSGGRHVLSAEAPNPAATSAGGGAILGPQAAGAGTAAGGAGGGAAEWGAAQDQYKLVIVGDSGVGKTCLMVRFTEAMFAEQIATVGVDFTARDVTVGHSLRVKLQLWDTAGQERYRAAMGSYYRGAQGVMFVYSVDDRRSFEAMGQWLRDVEKYSGPGCAKLLVGAKADIPAAERAVAVEEAEALAVELGLRLVETSAKHNHNVDEAFQLLAEEVHAKRPAKVAAAAGGGGGVALAGRGQLSALGDEARARCC
jgi:small GTP-binding protein